MRSILLRGFTSILVLAGFCYGKELCDRLKNDRVGSEEDFKERVGPWVQNEYLTWNTTKGHDNTPDHFWNYFHQKFAPRLADSIISCNLSSQCSTVSCEMIDEGVSLEEQLYAFRTMESVSNFHNQKYDTRGLIVENFQAVRADRETMIQRFSDGANIKLADMKHQAHEKQMLHIMLAVTQVAASSIGTVTGTNTLMGAGEVAVGEVAKTFMTRHTSSVLSIAQTASTVAGQIDVSYANIMFDLQSADNYVEKMTADVSHKQAKNEDIIRDMFAAEMYETLRGEKNMAGQTLADVVQSGQYREVVPRSPTLEKMNRDLVMASWISNFWGTERAYIAWSDAEGGSCDADQRGPPELKVCLSDYPNSVFHIYFISRILEGTQSKFRRLMKGMKGEALVRGPPGHQLLGHGDYANITLHDIVQASVAHYEDHGNMPPTSIKGQEGIDKYFSPDSALVQRGGLYRGIFSVPVCYESQGLGISSINMKHSRSYPCMCGKPPFTNRSKGRRTLFGRQENATVEAHIASPETNTTVEEFLVKREDWGFAEDMDPVETESFLSATGLFISKNWYDFCHKKHHPRCEKDKSFTMNFPQYDGKRTTLEHPFRKCKLTDHDYKGCDTPHNDGKKENENC